MVWKTIKETNLNTDFYFCKYYFLLINWNELKSKAKTNAAIKDHMLFFYTVSLEDFKILASSNSEFHLKIKESLLI